MPTRRGLVALSFGFIYLSYLGIALLGPLVVHSEAEPTKQALIRLFGGSFDIGWAAVLSVMIFGAIIVLKPLAAVGAIWLCELVVDPRARRRGDIGLNWLAQTCFLFLGTVFAMSLANLVPLPAPWLSLNARGVAAFSLAALPIYLLALLIGDFFEYWVHRALHAVPFLWRFHAIHHSQELDALHNAAHPVERLFKLLFGAVPAAIIIGPSGDQVIVLAALLGMQGNITHSTLPWHLGRFRLLLTDSRYHFLHHSRDPVDYNRNFAAGFPLWDLLFRTNRAPPEGPPAPTGLADRRPPETLGQFFMAKLPSR